MAGPSIGTCHTPYDRFHNGLAPCDSHAAHLRRRERRAPRAPRTQHGGDGSPARRVAAPHSDRASDAVCLSRWNPAVARLSRVPRGLQPRAQPRVVLRRADPRRDAELAQRRAVPGMARVPGLLHERGCRACSERGVR